MPVLSNTELQNALSSGRLTIEPRPAPGPGEEGTPYDTISVDLRLSTEISISDEKAWELCRAGFTPIIGMADGDIAYFPFLGNAYRPRIGSITIDQALTHQLYAGQLSHIVLKLSVRAPAGSPEEVCDWYAQQIFNFLSPFVGDAPGTHVKVTPVSIEGGGSVASIRVTPTFKIQDKAFDLELGIGLR